MKKETTPVGQRYEWRDGGLAEPEAKRRRGGLFGLRRRAGRCMTVGRKEATSGESAPRGGD